jgi:putative transposase
MLDYRRAFVPGGTFFFTLVTAGRAPILTDPTALSLLRSCIRDAQRRRPFTIQSFVLLPDHLHTIWTLPQDDADFSIRWSDIKGNFTREWLRTGGAEAVITDAQRDEGRRGVFQPRFMEHTIGDEDDFIAHIEYGHFNPVKHGMVTKPADWPHSTLHRYIRLGLYPSDWGCASVEEIERRISCVRADLLE